MRSTTICDKALTTSDDEGRTSDDEGRTSDESTTTRQGRRATERAAPASDGASCACKRRDRQHLTVGLVCSGSGVWFSLYWVFFFLINKSVLQYWVMGFGLLLLCMDCIWFSLPTTWPWIDFWFALYWFFFFLFFFFFWVRIHGFATYGLCWAWLAVGSGLGSVTIFFFFFGFFFFGGLESRTDNFFFFFNSRVFLILWLRVFLIWIKYNFFFLILFRLGCSWEHPDLYVAPPLGTTCLRVQTSTFAAIWLIMWRKALKNFYSILEQHADSICLLHCIWAHLHFLISLKYIYIYIYVCMYFILFLVNLFCHSAFGFCLSSSFLFYLFFNFNI